MIRFSSPTSGDVQMLDAHARQLLEVIGKSAGERGVIAAAEIPGALAALRSAIAKDAPQHAHAEDADDPDERDRQAQDVSLGRRAFPLMDMLERAARNGKDVTWGV
jgi:hypothetical protein